MFPATPERLRLAVAPTPLQLLQRTSQGLGTGHRIWVKRDDLTGCAASGNKIRKLEFVLAEALQQQCDTVITCGGIQSNHCRATAIMCAQLGLRCQLVLRGEPEAPADGNLLLDQLCGAEISLYPAAYYTANLDAILREKQLACSEEGRRAWIIPTGASDGIGIWGYINACRELRDDFRDHEIAPRHIVCATGSGGTQAGLAVGIEAFELGAQLTAMAVCDDVQYFQVKAAKDIAAWQARYGVWRGTERVSSDIVDAYIGPGYAKADRHIYKLIAHMARTEGLLLDPVYTAKAFYGMLEEIQRGRFGEGGDIVFIHTGGLFGLYPHKAHLARELT